MKIFGSAVFGSRSISLFLAAAVLVIAQEMSVRADSIESLLPPFAGKGYQFTKASKDDHHIDGWLPVKWCDNSKWAAVNATYTKLEDSPAPGAAAVRIKIEKVDDGQLQLTTFDGNSEYKKGTKYVVSGWARSEQFTPVMVGAREEDEPHDFYDHLDIPAGANWKRFEFVFTPEMDCIAWIMFVMKEPGTVDLAGISVVEKP